MRYVPFAKTGVQVSQMCLGTMMFGERCDQAESDRILGAAMDRGVTFIDTAAMYAHGGTEEILGNILKGRRDQLFITTKVHQGIDGATISTGIDASLKRMQTDHVDLYMIHWPQPHMHPEEMMQALNGVVTSGKARYVGFCNCAAWLFAHCNQIAAANHWAPLICNQVPYNLLERGIEVELVPQALAEGIAITTYRVLVIGLLAGKYSKGQPLPANTRADSDPRVENWLNEYGDGIAQLQDFATRLGVQPAQVAIAWVCQNPGVTSPIIGISSVNQLNPTIDAFDFTLTPDQYAEVTSFFDTAVKEEAGGKFPELRRAVDLIA